MASDECVKLVGDTMSEMGIGDYDITEGDKISNKNVLDYYFRKVKNLLNRAGKHNDDSPALLCHSMIDGTVQVRYNIDNVDVILYVPEKYGAIKNYII